VYRDRYGYNGYSTSLAGEPYACTGSLQTQVLSTHTPIPNADPHGLTLPDPRLPSLAGLSLLREAIKAVGDMPPAGTLYGGTAGSPGPSGSGSRGSSGGGSPGRGGGPHAGPVAGDGESEQAQDGNADAFGELYRIYNDTVFRYIYYRVSTRALAEDLTSETFVRALRRITTFSWQGRDFGAWLVTIARNLVADNFKSSRHRMEVSTGEMLDSNEVEASPEETVLEHLSNETLLDAVHRLNDQQRECVTLRFLQGLSVAETAEIMGKNEGAIKTLQYRAVRTLARLLPADAL
jgi:RNA polymerase sigma-70 factor (ECF subfamily)